MIVASASTVNRQTRGYGGEYSGRLSTYSPPSLCGWMGGDEERWRLGLQGGEVTTSLALIPAPLRSGLCSNPLLPSPPLPCVRVRERERERAGCLALFHSINVAATSQPQALQVHCTNCVCREQCQWSIPFHCMHADAIQEHHASYTRGSSWWSAAPVTATGRSDLLVGV
jgi:hypothetical protein